MKKPAHQRPESAAYQVFILTLSVFALGSLAVSATTRLEPNSALVLEYADNAVCALFLVDFFVCLFRAQSKRHYMVTWGWVDLLSCVPSVAALRLGRSVRAIRILRSLRGLRASKLVADLILQRRAENGVLAAALLATLLTVAASLAILHLESGPGANISTGADALWWAFATITTGGCEKFPTTGEGRVVAALLMAAGMGLLGILSGFMASWFLESSIAEPSEIAALRKEVHEMKELLSAHAARPR